MFLEQGSGLAYGHCNKGLCSVNEQRHDHPGIPLHFKQCAPQKQI